MASKAGRSLRASSPFRGVAKSHATAARERSRECQGRSLVAQFSRHKWRACLRTKRDARERLSHFAFGSRVTSRDSPKWRVCTQATGARHNLKACKHTGDHHSLFTPGPHYIYGKIKKYRRLIGRFRTKGSLWLEIQVLWRTCYKCLLLCGTGTKHKSWQASLSYGVGQHFRPAEHSWSDRHSLSTSNGHSDPYLVTLGQTVFSAR